MQSDFQVDAGTKLFGGVKSQPGGLTVAVCQTRLSCSAETGRSPSRGSRLGGGYERNATNEVYISRECEEVSCSVVREER